MNATIRVLVADDEPAVREGIRAYLEREPDCEVVGEVGDGRAALTAISDLRPDVVFLDVQMPELDGLGVVAALEADGAPVIVFVTAYEEYAVRAFDASATDYLLKPFDDERFRRALDRARHAIASGCSQGMDDHREVGRLLTEVRRLRSAADRFVVKKGNRVLLIPVEEVDSIEAAGNYAHLHHADGEYLVRETLASLETRLAERGFVRVHRSSIVRIDAIAELESLGTGDHLVKLNSGREMTLSRTYRRSFEAALGRGL